MSYAEWKDWVEYANKRGSLSLAIRIEQGLAQVCQLLAIGHGIKREGGAPMKLTDFLPHIRKDDEGVTMDEVMNVLTGGKYGK